MYLFFITGEHKGDNFYYAFDGQGKPMDVNEEVTFTFHDMSTHSVRLADCHDVGKEQLWTWTFAPQTWKKTFAPQISKNRFSQVILCCNLQAKYWASFTWTISNKSGKAVFHLNLLSKNVLSKYQLFFVKLLYISIWSCLFKWYLNLFCFVSPVRWMNFYLRLKENVFLNIYDFIQ